MDTNRPIYRDEAMAHYRREKVDDDSIRIIRPPILVTLLVLAGTLGLLVALVSFSRVSTYVPADAIVGAEVGNAAPASRALIALAFRGGNQLPQPGDTILVFDSGPSGPIRMVVNQVLESSRSREVMRSSEFDRVVARVAIVDSMRKDGEFDGGRTYQARVQLRLRPFDLLLRRTSSRDTTAYSVITPRGPTPRIR